MATLGDTVTLTTETCVACGITFGMPQFYHQGRRDDHATFYCPNGHGQHYAQRSEAERLRARLRAAEARETHERDQRQAAERSLAAQKGQTTRLRKRIAAGVCPCCNRSFQNVRRHMAGQHPDYVEAGS